MALTNLQANITLDVYDHDGAKPSIKTIALDDNTRYVLANIRSRGEVYDIGSSATVQLIVIRPDKVGVQIAGQAQGIEIALVENSFSSSFLPHDGAALLRKFSPEALAADPFCSSGFSFLQLPHWILESKARMLQDSPSVLEASSASISNGC